MVEQLRAVEIINFETKAVCSKENNDGLTDKPTDAFCDTI